MNKRAELVRLITAGTPTPDIIHFFIAKGLQRGEIDMLLNDCGVQFQHHKRFNDGISDQRRWELQAISTHDD